MTSSSIRARHRAARRPITPLSLFATAASENVVSVSKRSAMVAASSGLLVSMMAAAPASAAPVSDAAVSTVDVAALTSEARAALSTAPTVTVAADASWTIEQTEISVTPAPEPVKPRAVVAASRTAERTARTTTAATTTATTSARTTAAASTATPAAAVAEVAAPVSVAPASSAGSSIIDIASRYVGVPYVSGGTTPSGFDCSGFTSYVYAQAGISLPRTSGAQGGVGTVIPRDQAQPGDLIWSPGHIAIYAGGNSQIDSPKPGSSVQFRNIWQSNPTFIRVG